MKNFIKIFLTSLLITFIIIGCSELQEEIVTTSPDDRPNIVHPEGFETPGHPNFHKNAFFVQGAKFEDCQDCHGEKFNGGTSLVSCSGSGCHSSSGGPQHPENFADASHSDSHAKYMKSIVWKLENCSSCHGDDYSGSISGFSCKTCHSQENGPEACNTCHGDFSDPNKSAPPQDLSDENTISSRGVGAHSQHLYNVQNAKTVECENCHIVPENYDSPGHIDDGKAEVLSNSFISYDNSTATCSNTYCHGSFEFSNKTRWANVYTADKITGNARTVQWNKVDGSEKSCGTCHGLPPAGHKDFSSDFGQPTLNTCGVCHLQVMDTNGNIINKEKHINGKVNVFDQEY